MFKTVFFRFLIFLVGHLPLGWLRMLGRHLGNLAWLSRSRMWLVTKENIDLCYPNLDPHRRLVLAKESLRETGKTMTETCFAWTRNPDTVLVQVESVSGLERVRQSQREARGIVFVIPHQGNWEVINHYLGFHFGLTHMFQPNRNQSLNDFIQKKRQITGTQFVPTNLSGIKAQLQILKSGGCIGIMPDQEPIVHTGRFARFFGIPALTNELTRGFAKTPSDFYIAVCERSQTGFNIQLDPIPLDPKAPAQDFLDTINLGMEQAIRRQPAQYLWSYKRFRTRPEGELDFYQFDRHPVRTLTESLSLAVYQDLFARLSLAVIASLAGLLNRLPVARKRRRLSRINLKFIDNNFGLKQEQLVRESMDHTLRAALETPWIWRSNPLKFAARITLPVNPIKPGQGAIVLTPPLGSREALVRFLAIEHLVTEYYHSNSITSLDQMIRAGRTAMGIKLVEHDEPGRSRLRRALEQGEVVTLCPDQQPRLRGGIFVNFFGRPALTTLAIPNLLKATRCQLILGYALREGTEYKIMLEPIEYDPHGTDEDILTQTNAALETAIAERPGQYRWSDKRFNIQPIGQNKVYR